MTAAIRLAAAVVASPEGSERSRPRHTSHSAIANSGSMGTAHCSRCGATTRVSSPSMPVHPVYTTRGMRSSARLRADRVRNHCDQAQ